MTLPSLDARFPPPEASNWRTLLDLALPAIDYVFPHPRKAGSEPDWTLGGGTALAMTIEHRHSYDIDIFIANSTLRRFAPGTQPDANPHSGKISSKMQWPGHYIKFECEGGEVDFLASGLLTANGFAPYDYKGREVAIEKPEEIILKKVRYRTARFTPRDVFDLASAERGYGHGAIANAIATYAPDMIPALRSVIAHMDYPGHAKIMPTPEFADLMKDGKREALLVVESAAAALARANGKTGHP